MHCASTGKSCHLAAQDLLCVLLTLLELAFSAQEGEVLSRTCQTHPATSYPCLFGPQPCPCGKLGAGGGRWEERERWREGALGREWETWTKTTFSKKEDLCRTLRLTDLYHMMLNSGRLRQDRSLTKLLNMPQSRKGFVKPVCSQRSSASHSMTNNLDVASCKEALVLSERGARSSCSHSLSLTCPASSRHLCPHI